MDTLQNKILGSMVGGAVGDALGYPVEFMNYDQIVAKYGSKGITRYELNDKGVAEISDDTQMSLYTANAILNCKKNEGNVLFHDKFVEEAYLEWLDTQMLTTPPDKDLKCWISQLPEMYTRRAPGNTCMSALMALKHDKPVSNSSKGCGGIMRIAPWALYCQAHNITQNVMCSSSADFASITHKHYMGWLPACLLSYALWAVVLNPRTGTSSIEASVKAGINYLKYFGPTEISRPLIDDLDTGSRLAMELSRDKMADERAIRLLGEGWTADEAWYVSLYCVLKHIDSFEDAVVAAVNHSGDSDSTGAITGNIMGAIHGYDAIPEYYKQNLELRDVIETMANDLYTGKISR